MRAFAARWAGFLALALLLSFVPAAAQTLPRLTGRVVDNANILDASTRAELEMKLAGLESQSGIQLVVATVPSLGGIEIEPYANRLFRTWQLGEKQKDNGVLLLVAPAERKVRIEVGYGLEGTLTDALSKIIITNAITPRFKNGDFSGGVRRGVEDIVTVLTTDAAEWGKRPDLRAESEPDLMDKLIPLFVLALFIFVVVSIVRNGGNTPAGRAVRRNGRVIVLPPVSSGSWGGGSSWSSGSSGGGFSGGGGSSGGGGASGSW